MEYEYDDAIQELNSTGYIYLRTEDHRCRIRIYKCKDRDECLYGSFYDNFGGEAHFSYEDTISKIKRDYETYGKFYQFQPSDDFL